MWPNQSYYDSSFKRNPIAFNLRPRHPSYPSQGPRPMLQPYASPISSNSQRVPFLSANKRTLANLPASMGSYANSPQFTTKIDRRNMPNLNSPVFTGRSSSPVFSSNILETKSDADGIPFLDDGNKTDSFSREKSRSIESAVVSTSDDTPLVSKSIHTDYSPASSKKVNSFISPAISSSSLYDNIPPPMPSSSLYDNIPPPASSEPTLSNRLYESDHKHVETSSLADTSNQRLQASAPIFEDLVNHPVSEAPVPPSPTCLPFNISKVLGDAKMLNDILSVAKTIQFSEQSKSVNFPTCSSKSVAIVQPINVHTDSTSCFDSLSSLISESKSSYQAPESSITPPPFVPPLLRSWTEDLQGKNNITSSTSDINSSQKNSTWYSDVKENSLDKSLNIITDETECLGNSLVSYAISPIDDSKPHSPANRSLKRLASDDDDGASLSPDSFNKVAKLEPVGSTNIPDELPSINEMKCTESPHQPVEIDAEIEEPLARESEEPLANEIEEPLTKEIEESLANEIEKPLAEEIEESLAKESEEPLAKEIEEPLSKADLKSALFTELGKCNITSNEEAETVLEVISMLSEAYLKYKLRFLPESKFQNLMSGIREAKEKETNFVLGFLKCGSGNREEATPPVPAEDDADPPPPVPAEEDDKPMPPEPTEEDIVPPPPVPPEDDVKPPPPSSSDATISSEQVEPIVTVSEPVSTAASFPRLEPFIPMYTSGNMTMPLNYWMAVPPQPMVTSPFAQLPPLPPPLITHMQPPLPPLPPEQQQQQQLAPPPLPFADVPLPPE